MRPINKGIALIVLVTSVSPAALIAQTAPVPAPNFSGVWIMDRTRSESAAQEQPVSDTTVRISQTAAAVSIESIRDGKKEVAIYPIGAKPSDTNEVSGASRAFWDGSMLVDEGSVDVNGHTIAFREGRMSSADGAEMVVETTLKIEHGYELKGGQTIVTGKNVYVRSR